MKRSSSCATILPAWPRIRGRETSPLSERSSRRRPGAERDGSSLPAISVGPRRNCSSSVSAWTSAVASSSPGSTWTGASWSHWAAVSKKVSTPRVATARGRARILPRLTAERKTVCLELDMELAGRGVEAGLAMVEKPAVAQEWDPEGVGLWRENDPRGPAMPRGHKDQSQVDRKSYASAADPAHRRRGGVAPIKPQDLSKLRREKNDGTTGVHQGERSHNALSRLKCNLHDRKVNLNLIGEGRIGGSRRRLIGQA